MQLTHDVQGAVCSASRACFRNALGTQTMPSRVRRFSSTLRATVAIGFLVAGTALAASPDWPWVAYGDLRGNIEPCGCDPASDLGGLRRIASLLRTERIKRPELWVFDLGNDLAGVGAEDQLVNDLIAKSRLAFGPTATLVNITELAASKAFPGRAVTGVTVLSNLRSNAPWPEGVRPYVRTGSAIVLGYTYRSDLEDKGVERVGEALFKRWEEILLEKGKGLTRILLFSGGDEDLERIANQKLFDLVISSNTAPIGQVPTQIEKTEPNRLQRLVSDGLEVHMVPLGGQGVLRGSQLCEEGNVQSVVDPLRSGKDSSTASPPGGSLTSVPAIACAPAGFVTWLGPEWDAGAPLEGEFEEYKKLVALRFRDRSNERRAALMHSPYVGSDSCQSCHKAAFKGWKKSAHAHALNTLKVKGKNEDPTCVSCHVTGFREVGGFVSELDSLHLANVGCENCHGPRREHAGNPKASKDPKGNAARARAVCSSCHLPPHSTKFAFDIYWKRIAHGK